MLQLAPLPETVTLPEVVGVPRLLPSRPDAELRVPRIVRMPLLPPPTTTVLAWAAVAEPMIGVLPVATLTRASSPAVGTAPDQAQLPAVAQSALTLPFQLPLTAWAAGMPRDRHRVASQRRESAPKQAWMAAASVLRRSGTKAHRGPRRACFTGRYLFIINGPETRTGKKNADRQIGAREGPGATAAATDCGPARIPTPPDNAIALCRRDCKQMSEA